LEAPAISRAVFAYYRWLGWLDPVKPLATQIPQALELAERFRKQPAAFTDEDLIARGVPAWVSGQATVTSAWMRALQAEPRLWLRARPGRGPALATKLGDCRAAGKGPLADALEYLGSKDLFRTAEFQQGEFELQDISSQLVGLLCAPRPGEVWWDACAGEGGKTLHLSGLMENKGLIWATDRSLPRLRVLKRRAARAGVFNYRLRPWDADGALPTKTLFDGVLVDAPCSGLGTWQRNPHARWTTTPEDVEELRALQLRLLGLTARAVKAGGKLVYAACTLTRAETIEVAEAFSKQFPEFEPLLLPNPLDESAAAQGSMWLWPQKTGGNGMFVAAWKRRKPQS
jgi:16S rRNA (cytosine967-C5)-methyltransferase